MSYRRSNLFVHSVLIYVFDWVKPSNWYFIVWFSMLWCYAIVSEKGKRFGTIQTFNPAANVCTCPKSGIWCTVVVVCLCNVYVFLVSRFFIWIRPLVVPLEWFYTSNFGALYSFLFGVSQGSVLKAVHWHIMVYFDKLLFGWRVVSLALTPHLPISIRYNTRDMLKRDNLYSG